MLIEQKRQHLDETVSVDASSILWILSDSYCRYILQSIKDVPKSCMEISAECKIPISTVYRRMQQLQDHKLVHVNGMISNDGKKFFLYRSKINSVHAMFENKLTVDITYR